MTYFHLGEQKVIAFRGKEP